MSYKSGKFVELLSGVVECMAAGLIMLSHRSGGPRMDIVDEREESRTGFLAETAEEYADHIVHIVNLPKQQLDKIRQAARYAHIYNFMLVSSSPGVENRELDDSDIAESRIRNRL